MRRGRAVPGAGLLVLGSLLLSSVASGDDTRIATGFQPVKAKSADPSWCWSACIQMCIRATGSEITQPEIRDQSRQPVNGDGIPRDMPGTLVLDEGRKTAVTVSLDEISRPLKRGEVLNAFDKGELIVAEMGEDNPWDAPAHAVVLYGYRIDLMNQMKILVYDPYPGEKRPEIDFRDPWDWKSTMLLYSGLLDSANKETYYKDAPQCLSLTYSDVQWGPSLEGGTLYYALTYRNTCDLAVRCAVTVESGNEAHAWALAGAVPWVLSQSRTQAFILQPGASYTVRGGLKWRRLETGTPRILYPSPNRGENVQLIRCDYLSRPTSG